MIDVETLELKARVLAGYDDGDVSPITEAERAEMILWADAELGYPPEEAPSDDAWLARWFLGAMNAYVQDKCM